jgi:small subunit ribosomal protein S3
MGRKVHPVGMRLGINQGWQGRWFAEGSQYRDQLHQDFAIRSLLLGMDSKGGSAKNTDVRKLRKDLPDTIKNSKAGVSRVEVERFPGKIRVAIHTAKRYFDRSQRRRRKENSPGTGDIGREESGSRHQGN